MIVATLNEATTIAAKIADLAAERRVGQMWARAAERVAASPITGMRAYARGLLPAVVDPGAFRPFMLLNVPPAEWPAWWSVVGLATSGQVQPALSHLEAVGWRRAAVPLVLAVGLAGLWGLAARGFLMSSGAPWRWVGLGVVAYLLLLSGGPSGNARFRTPAVPVLAVLAGVAVSGVRPGRP